MEQYNACQSYSALVFNLDSIIISFFYAVKLIQFLAKRITLFIMVVGIISKHILSCIRIIWLQPWYIKSNTMDILEQMENPAGFHTYRKAVNHKCFALLSSIQSGENAVGQLNMHLKCHIYAYIQLGQWLPTEEHNQSHRLLSLQSQGTRRCSRERSKHKPQHTPKVKEKKKSQSFIGSKLTPPF